MEERNRYPINKYLTNRYLLKLRKYIGLPITTTPPELNDAERSLLIACLQFLGNKGELNTNKSILSTFMTAIQKVLVAYPDNPKLQFHANDISALLNTCGQLLVVSGPDLAQDSNPNAKQLIGKLMTQSNTMIAKIIEVILPQQQTL